MRAFIRILLLAFALFGCPLIFGLSPRQPRIMLVDSNSLHDLWSHKCYDALSEKILHRYPNAVIDYVDLNTRQNTATTIDAQLRMMIRSLNSGHYDLLIAIRDDAIEGVLANSSLLPPELPVILCDLNQWDESFQTRFPSMTGTHTVYSDQLMNVALQLFPNATEIQIIAANPNDPSKMRRLLPDDWNHSFGDVKISLFSGLDYNTTGMLNALKRSSDRILTILVSWHDPAIDGIANMRIVTRMMQQKSFSPLFTNSQALLTPSMIGGVMSRGETHGKLAGELAIAIMNGKKPSNLPFICYEPELVINRKSIEKFGIPLSQLPIGAVLYNEESYSFLRNSSSHSWWFIPATAGPLLLIIVLLSVFYARQKRELRQYRAMVDMLPLRFVVADPDGNTLFVHDNPIWSKNLSDVIIPFHTLPKPVIQEWHDVFDSREIRTIHYEFSGQTRNACFLPLPDKVFKGKAALWVSENITETILLRKKLAALQQSNSLLMQLPGRAILLLDAEGVIVDANPECCTLWECPPENLLGKNAVDLLQLSMPGDMAKIAISPSRPYSKRNLVLHTGRTRNRYVAIHCIPFDALKNTPGAIVIETLDQEFALHEEINDLKEMFNIASALTQVSAFAFNFPYDKLVCRGVPGMNWKTDANQQPVPPEQFVHPDDLKEFLAQWRQLTSHAVNTISLRFRSKDSNGAIRYLAGQANSYYNLLGELRFCGAYQNITNHAELQKDHDATASLLKNLMEYLPLAISVKDVSDQFRYVKVNRSFCGLAGASSPEILGKTVKEIFPTPSQADQVESDDNIALESNLPFSRNYHWPERRLSLQVLKFTYRQNDGKMMLATICIDITQQQVSNKRCETLKALLHTVCDHLPQGIFVRVPATHKRYCLWNRTLEQQTGLKKTDLPRTFEEDLPLFGDAIATEQRFQQVMSSGVPLEFTDTISGLDREFPCQVQLIPIFPDAGDAALIGILSPLAETTIPLSEDFPMPVWLFNPGQYCIYASTATAGFEGIKTVPAIGKAVAEVLGTELARILSSNMTSPTIHSHEWSSNQKTYQIKSLRKRDGSLLVIAVDVTNWQNRHKQNLLKSKLNQIEKIAHSAYARSIYNALGSQLNAILGYAELAANLNHFNPEDATLLKTIFQVGRRQQETIAVFHALIGNDAGTTSFPNSTEPIPPLLRTLSREFRTRIAERKLKIELKITSPLPSLSIDGLRFRQLLAGLLGILSRHAENGFLTLSAAWSENRLAFTLSDTGCDTTQLPKNPETVLELETLEQMAKALNFDLTVERIPGVGNLLHLSCPAPQLQQADDTSDVPAHFSAALSPDSQWNFHTLLVENDRIMQDVLSAMLRSLGCTVTPVTTIDDALTALLSLKPAILILGNGFTFAELERITAAIHDSPRRNPLRIVVIADDPNDSAPLPEVVDAVLTKPILPENLATLFRKFLSATP